MIYVSLPKESTSVLCPPDDAILAMLIAIALLDGDDKRDALRRGDDSIMKEDGLAHTAHKLHKDLFDRPRLIRWATRSVVISAAAA
jgi:hypothetical protein